MLASMMKAFEIKARWLRWLESEEGRYRLGIIGALNENDPNKFAGIMKMYQMNLAESETFFMNYKFAELVDHARLTVPDELAFDETWMHSKKGFLWLETPFSCPTPREHTSSRPKLVAMGWCQGDGAVLKDEVEQGPRFPGYLLMFYYDLSQNGYGEVGFGCWSYVFLRPGETLLERIKTFEYQTNNGTPGIYPDTKDTYLKHEIRCGPTRRFT